MAKTVIFRADGNATNGLGHLYRLFSLVEMIKDRFDFIFLTKEESTTEVIPNDYKVFTIPKSITIDKEPEWFNSQFSAESHSVIADGYHFDSSYQYKLKQQGFKLIYIDDLATESMFADVVINHSPYLKTTDYKKQPYTKLALGTQFGLLRPEFLKVAQQKRELNRMDTAFVCFGGADPLDLTMKAVQALLNIKQINQTHVVLGSAYKHEDLFELVEKHPKEICVHLNLSEHELVEIMKASHLAIAPASTILYELCSVKMPVLSGFYVDNQELIYKGFLEKDVIYEGGNMEHYEMDDFFKKIQNILDRNNHVQIMEAQNELFDGHIKSRFVNLIEQIC